MMSTRLFVSAPLGNGKLIELTGEQARYLGRVLRARAGETLALFNGDDGEWQATILRITKSAVELEVGEHIPRDSESELKMHLVQGISRGERMDFVVQKATELGVKRVTPVFTDYGVVKLDDKRAAKRLEHWQRIGISASEQCGRIRPPLIDPPIALNRWFGDAHAGDSTQLVLHPNANSPFCDAGPPTSKLCLLIGPEGGFSDREFDDASVAGFQPVSLGPRILRTETAAVAVLAVAQSLWGDLNA
ncbi:MAG: 16S rRNA (uracil(1498)-N(3))-methyltransferase [Woeseiaceae bacterium]|nr:16S rRNA (uracil(1498)-N(3))-methyltransferase [Woeseiaceae bacterium]